ncbi:MAG: endolytic transglycosylase MltG [Lachnospiraceae bacterium]|nr:endolytic transglycosylase MltG [Candidatus Colinaster scatohippi]
MDIKEIVLSVFSVAIKIVVGVIVVMFIYKYALVAYDYGYRIFSEPPMTDGEGRTVSVSISPEMDAETIGQVLENKGLIRDAKLFRLQERLSEYHGKIQPGIYDLTTAMTAEEMIAIMAADAVDSQEEESEIDNNYIMAESTVEFDDFDEEMPAEGFEPVVEDGEEAPVDEAAGDAQ